MRVSAAFLSFIAIAAFSTTALAVDWQPVASSGGERMEIDKARILRTAPGKTTAWTRLVLGREVADAKGNYTVVQAMNRYDCEARRFATVKRVYLKADRMVREENVSSPREIAVGEGSVDDRLLNEACKLRTVGEAQKVAEAAALAAIPKESRPGVMHADMLSAVDIPTAKTMPVADTAMPEVKPEPKPAGDRPRFIDLPKIDKSQVEDPNPGAKPGEAKPGGKPAEAKPAMRAAEKPTAPVSRQERERQLATSGLRRVPTARRASVEEQAVVGHENLHWSYDGEGSPANWGKLRPDYATCATGRRQSPIDIREGIRVDLEPIAIDYKLSQFRIVDNGHTIQVSVGEGSTIAVMGRTYRLLQFHFHRPSEERVNGKTFDMVIHFVHQDDEGKLAVIAVLLEKGSEHPVIQTLWNNMPLEIDQDVAPAEPIELNALLPKDRAYYTYMGSLTTPPCSEDVLWMVFRQPMQISAEQVAIFSRLYKNNARPIQPSNNRLIKENR
jgi:carbonic anhydrase